MDKNHQGKAFAFSKFLLLIFGGFLVVVIVVVSLGGYYWQINKDDLSKYVPEDAILYIRINQSIWPNENKLSDLNLENLYQAINDKLKIDTEQDVLSRMDRQVAIALIKLPDDEIGTAVLVKTNNQKGQYKRLSNQVSNYLDFDTVLVFADSQQTIEQISDTIQKRKLSLSGTVNTELFEDDFVKFYINLDQAVARYQAEENQTQKLITNFIKQSNAGSLILSLDKQFGHYKFESDFAKTAESNLYPNEIVKFSGINTIPKDAILFIKGLDMVSTFNDIKAIDTELISEYKSNVKNIANQNYLDVVNQIMPIFSSGIDLLLVKDSNMQHQLAINFSLPENFAISDISKIISDILANRYPTEQERILPDKTTVIEIIKRPQDFEFEQSELSGTTIYHINREEIDFKLAYTIQNNEIILASSLDVLQRLSSNPEQQINIEQLNKQCWAAGRNRFLAFNKEQLVEMLPQELSMLFNYLPSSLYIISQDRGLDFSGCMY